MITLIKQTKMPTYDFTGDFTTFLGFVGVISTAIILFTAFRRFYHSLLNR
jgi:hypothetical protein